MRKAWVIAVLSFALVAGAAEKRGVTPEDYFAFENISDLHISPDGRNIAYVRATVDQRRNRRDNSIWMVATDDASAPRRLTADGANSTSPRWRPDGSRLAFLSRRGGLEEGAAISAAGTAPGAGSGAAQVCILPMDGGEAQVLSHLKNGLSSFQWAPDGTQLVVVSRSGPSDAVAPSACKSDVRHYTHISYKFNDTGWFDDKRTHLWVVDVATGEAKQITSGDDWNDTDPQWSPEIRRTSRSCPTAPARNTTAGITRTCG